MHSGASRCAGGNTTRRCTRFDVSGPSCSSPSQADARYQSCRPPATARSTAGRAISSISARLPGRWTCTHRRRRASTGAAVSARAAGAVGEKGAPRSGAKAGPGSEGGGRCDDDCLSPTLASRRARLLPSLPPRSRRPLSRRTSSSFLSPGDPSSRAPHGRRRCGPPPGQGALQLQAAVRGRPGRAQGRRVRGRRDGRPRVRPWAPPARCPGERR